MLQHSTEFVHPSRRHAKHDWDSAKQLMLIHSVQPQEGLEITQNMTWTSCEWSIPVAPIPFHLVVTIPATFNIATSVL